MGDDELTGHRAPRARGFSTRAILAASRVAQVDQRPSRVPMYQTATFSSADGQELEDLQDDFSAALQVVRGAERPAVGV